MKRFVGVSILMGSVLLAGPAQAGQPAPSLSMVDAAFIKTRAVMGDDAPSAMACYPKQLAIVEMRGSVLAYPCMLAELVEDADDATMLVTLLLTQADEAPRNFATDDASFGEKAAAVGAAVIGPQLDPVSDAERVERYSSDRSGADASSLARYFPRDSQVLAAEARRVQREQEAARTSNDATERQMELTRVEREREERESARYRSTSEFMTLAGAQGFCPADGRAFLARAIEYSTSPLRQDRIVGLWASERRETLGPYLNDVSRCD